MTGLYLSVLPAMIAELVPEKYKDVYLSREQNQNAPILDNDPMRFFDRKFDALLPTYASPQSKCLTIPVSQDITTRINYHR